MVNMVKDNKNVMSFRVVALVVIISVVKNIQCDFELSVIHINDFHARFEPINYITGSSCSTNAPQCVGGFSRIYTLINKLKRERPNALVINAGDNFQGSIWYNIFKWNVTLHFMNLVPTDVYTLGNHEFDDGIAGVVPFIRGLKSHVVVANMDARNEPEIRNLYNRSVVIIKAGKRIGVIGAITTSTSKSSRAEDLVFLDESASVNQEADRLVTEENVDTIIVVSHCGYNIDKVIAQNASSRIGLIVGGHSHDFLYTGKNPPGPDIPKGDYPTVIKHSDGRKILIVQASAFTKYLGNITLYYDKDGAVVNWDGAPIFIDNSIPTDEWVNKELEIWKTSLDVYKQHIVGESKVLLDRNQCWSGECNIGSFLADAMVWTYQRNKGSNSTWSKYAPIGLLNAGGIRSSIQVGNITYADVLNVHPYGNTWDYGYIKGYYIIDAINKTIGGQLMQVSGLRAIYDFKNKAALEVQVKCNQCSSGYENVNLDQIYLVAIPSFFAKGGDGLWDFAANLKNHTVGPADVDALEAYIRENSPITREVDGRINRISTAERMSTGNRHTATWSYLYLSLIVVVYVD